MSSDEELIEKISRQLTKANTTSFDLSFNEIMDMYSDEEINITPDYQRLFRWTEGQRSRFIESLLLEMPVPPIFVIEVEENKYELIDGLQRISSYLHLRGAPDAPHLPEPVAPGDKLTLTECDIVPDLNGRSYETLPTSLQIRLKRSFIRVEVVRRGADPNFRYHMFKRLNTGGERLSDQQIRNCAVRMLSSEFPDFLIALAKSEDFEACIPNLTDDRKLSGFTEELALRFLALKNNISSFKHEVSEFLTDYMESVADPQTDTQFNFDAERENFKKTFAVLSKSMGERSFAFARNGKLQSGFGIYHFEAVSIGIQRVLDRLNANDSEQMQKLAASLESIKLDPEFVAMTTGGGKNSPGPLKDRINFVGDRLDGDFE